MASYTPEQFNAVNEEYELLRKAFRPEFGNVAHINLLERMGVVSNYERLRAVQKSKIAANSYRKKIYDGKKTLAPLIKYYSSLKK